MLKCILTCIFFCNCPYSSIWIISSLRIAPMSCFSIKLYLSVLFLFQVIETQRKLTQWKVKLQANHKKGGAGLMHEWAQEWLVTCPQSGLCSSQGFPWNFTPSGFPAWLGTWLLATSKWQSHSSWQVRKERLFFSFYRNVLETAPDWLCLGCIPIPGTVSVAAVPWLAQPALCVCSCEKGGYIKGKNSGQKGKGLSHPPRAYLQATRLVLGK